MVLTGPTGGSTIVPGRSTATVNLVDDDGQRGSLTLTVNQTSVEAQAGFVRAVVTRSGGASGAASVEVRATNGSAIEGTDFLLGAGGIETLTWGPGESGPKVATISLLAGEPGTPSKSFSLSLQGSTGATIDGGSSLVTVSIAYPRVPENSGVGGGGMGLGLLALFALLGLLQQHSRNRRASSGSTEGAQQ